MSENVKPAKIAQYLLEYAEHLEKQSGSNPYRALAFRQAADTILRENRDLRQLAKDHRAGGLMSLPGVGPGIAAFIEEILFTGRSSQLDRIRWSQEPRQILTTVPGVGPHLSRRIVQTLNLRSLEALQEAVSEGRIADVPGVGKARAEAIAALIENLYSPHSQKTSRPPPRLKAA